MYTFVQQMFAEPLLCTNVSVKHLGHSHDQDRSPCSGETCILVGEIH